MSDQVTLTGKTTITAVKRRKRRPHWRVVLSRWWKWVLTETDAARSRRSEAAKRAAATRKARDAACPICGERMGDHTEETAFRCSTGE